uniref:Uncharacterized protein n=1 Tax=Arion vulgaris TaxID=1028688 RepID=A0A0B7AN93_9EUPU
MTGEILENEKESFWKDHQDTLVRLRRDLVSGKTNRSKFSPSGNATQMTTGVAMRSKTSKHPPFGKYRRTPSPYLPKLSSPTNHKNLPSPRKLEVVPPVQPKLAFTKPNEDYDSWGEMTDDEADDYVDDSDVKTNIKSKLVPKSHRRTRQSWTKRKRYKPQPYPQIQAHSSRPDVYAAPFYVYYPPPPKDLRGNQKHQFLKADKNKFERGHHDHHQSPSFPSRSRIPKKTKKGLLAHVSAPVYSSDRLMPAVTVMHSPTSSVDEEGDEELVDESTKSAFLYWKQHPLFASDFTDWFVQDCCHTELLPDFLIEACNQMKHMPYDHPLYVPSLYSCEDLVADHVSEIVMDIVRETISEIAYDYADETMLQRDPLDDFLTTLTDDVVTMGTREIVRSAVVELAEDYLQVQFATDILHNLVDDYLGKIGSSLIEDAIFDLRAEDFLWSEVIGPEVKEEAQVIAMETLQHYDNKVIRKEFKQVKLLAENKLADVVMMELIMSVISQQGKLYAEDDHINKYLDGMIFNESVAQVFSIQKDKDKTLYCKPLHKLHEKAVSDVALDVFMQQLTRTLDEDLADIDEYERGVTDETLQLFPVTIR